jgi:hypothetical protein
MLIEQFFVLGIVLLPELLNPLHELVVDGHEGLHVWVLTGVPRGAVSADSNVEVRGESRTLRFRGTGLTAQVLDDGLVGDGLFTQRVAVIVGDGAGGLKGHSSRRLFHHLGLQDEVLGLHVVHRDCGLSNLHLQELNVLGVFGVSERDGCPKLLDGSLVLALLVDDVPVVGHGPLEVATEGPHIELHLGVRLFQLLIGELGVLLEVLVGILNVRDGPDMGR